MKRIVKSLRMLWLRCTVLRNASLGTSVYIARGTKIRRAAKLSIGSRVAIGENCYLDSREMRIGNDVMLAGSVAIVERNAHQIHELGKTFEETGPQEVYPTIIESDVWIGYGCILLSGVTIGRGSVVAAGCVVVEDVPPYSIVAGHKARVIKRRMTDEEIQEHQSLLQNRGRG